MGQFLFTGRFVVQWLSSEREKKSVIPPVFWTLSIAGATVLLIYAIHKRDIVFTLGQSSGLLIYLRNIYFIRNEKKLNQFAESVSESDKSDQRSRKVA
jgi:lipid-A-disaccharide synthase-like uncharacterized protein